MAICDILNALMREKETNPNQLGSRCRVPQATIHRIASGESKEPRRSTLVEIAKALGVSVDVFYATTPMPKVSTPPVEYTATPSRAGALAEAIRSLPDDHPALDALAMILAGAGVKVVTTSQVDADLAGKIKPRRFDLQTRKSAGRTDKSA
jgi:transcriptional regulator with XRE-family HTH domain